MEFQLMREGLINKTRGHSFFPAWIRKREFGHRLPLGHSDAIYKSLYSSISPCHSWAGGETAGKENGLFSLEFSPEGTLLVAGCENSSLQMFDPLSHKLNSVVPNAHTDTVMKVKFLDSQIFATGSVDRTVSLWDIRNLKSRLRTLIGYSSKIGNLEFSQKNNFLITTGLANTIYVWDMKNWEKSWEFNMFMPHCFRRLRLNSDETKMVISTENGYLLIVHDLDLNRIVQDLKEFVLEMFDFASLTQANTTSGWSSSRFEFPKRRRNRVEIVADFPNADGCIHVISALEMHPQGWSVISRSNSEESGIELTCVHDIQDKNPSDRRVASQRASGEDRLASPQQDDTGGNKRQRLEVINEERCSPGSSGRDVGVSQPFRDDAGRKLPDVFFSLEREARKRRSVSSADSARARSPTPGPSSAPDPSLEAAGLGSNPASSRDQDPSLPRLSPSVAQLHRVHVHVPRLTHYIHEPHGTDWYVSSLSVSADGRLMCSPFHRGIRLLAFAPECSEQSVSWCGTNPRPLYELSTHGSYNDTLLSAKFSPRHILLVTGSLDGKLKWYQPVV